MSRSDTSREHVQIYKLKKCAGCDFPMIVPKAVIGQVRCDGVRDAAERGHRRIQMMIVQFKANKDEDDLRLPQTSTPRMAWQPSEMGHASKLVSKSVQVGPK